MIAHVDIVTLLTDKHFSTEVALIEHELSHARVECYELYCYKTKEIFKGPGWPRVGPRMLAGTRCIIEPVIAKKTVDAITEVFPGYLTPACNSTHVTGRLDHQGNPLHTGNTVFYRQR